MQRKQPEENIRNYYGKLNLKEVIKTNLKFYPFRNPSSQIWMTIGHGKVIVLTLNYFENYLEFIWKKMMALIMNLLLQQQR